MSEPTLLVAGDTVTWTVPAGDYDAGTWTLSYVLQSKDKEKYTLTASNNNGDHLIAIAAATTADWIAGEYFWQRYVTSGTTRYTTGRGRIEVKANFQTATEDPRSSAQIALDALLAVRENKATSDQLSMSIQGRSISRMTWTDMNEAVSHFQRLVNDEISEENDALGTETQSNTVKVSFNNV